MSNLAERISALSPQQRALLDKQLQAKRQKSLAALQTITPRRQGDSCPLSLEQEHLWFLDQLEPDSFAYNLSSSYQLVGALNLAALARCFNDVIRRHEALRTRFVSIDGRPRQVIAPSLTLKIPVIDLTSIAETERPAHLQPLITTCSQTPFDLSVGPMIRATLFKLSDTEYRLLMSLHHIVTDRWSFSLLWRELMILYEAFSKGLPSPLPELPVQFPDFALWQREWLKGDALETRLSYWKKQLAGASFILDLPTDRPRPPNQTFIGKRQYRIQNKALWSSLKSLCRQENTTLFMALLAAYYVLLYRYTGQRDIVVGTPYANRNRVETEGIIGYLLNMLVLRADMSGDPAFLELLGRVREMSTEAYANNELPFARLIEELQPERDLSRNPLFQVTFVFVDFPEPAVNLADLALKQVDLDMGSSIVDLMLGIRDQADPILIFEYNIDLFDDATITRMMVHYETLLESIVNDSSKRISALSIVPDEERIKLLEQWNETSQSYPHDALVHELFELQAERTPEATAVIWENQKLSYRELNARANQLARELRARGVGPDILAGILMDRSIEMVVTLLGILKAGGGYVPIDPAYPQERLAFIINDAGVSLVVTQSKHSENLSTQHAAAICIDSAWAGIVRHSSENLHHLACAENVAYVIYTSGSTGQPKGVQLCHGSLTNCVSSIQREPGLSANDVVLAITNLWFDIATLELLLPLITGARLVIGARTLASDGEQLAAKLEEAEVTVMQATPATWSLLIQSGWQGRAGLRVLSGGEALGRNLADELMMRTAAVWNLYGPSETTIYSTGVKVEQSAGPVSIGRGIANTQVYVLDEQLNVLPIGCTGELYIGGAGLGRGYIRRPDLTAEKFIANPFSDRRGERMYRTGDLVRYLPDGRLEYLGRRDGQVKVRGYRIELGEIEAVLAAHATVRACVVMAREDVAGDQRLVAYVVGAPASVAEWRRHLKQQLPEYMAPSSYVVLERLPLTPNGKVDRRALPAPERAGAAERAGYVAPRTVEEELVATIWGEVLGVERVSVHDNFFELGGHSLLATQVVSRIRTLFRMDLALRALFDTASVAELAELITAERVVRGRCAAPAIGRRGQERAPLSYAQQRLWFLDQFEPQSAFYNVPVALYLRGALRRSVLGQSVSEIARRHEVLRTSFPSVAGQPMQVIAPAAPVPLPLIDLQGLSKGSRDELGRGLAAAEAARPFALGAGPVWRVALLRLSAEEHLLLVTMHHIITDGWSRGVLIRELTALYEAYSREAESGLAECPIQYADFAMWQREWLQGEVLERQLRYWEEQLRGAATLELPTDYGRPAVQSYGGAQGRVRLSAELTRGLGELSRHEGVTLFMTLLSGWQTLLGRYSGQWDLSVGTPIANRTRGEVEGLIGFFVNTLVLRTRLRAAGSFVEQLQQVREVCLGAYAHQDVPFEMVVEQLQPARDLSRSPLFQVVFVLQNAPQGEIELEGVKLEPLGGAPHTIKFDLTLTAMETEGGLVAWCDYNRELFAAETIARMLAHWRVLLAGAVADPGQALWELPLLTAAEREQLRAWNETTVVYPREGTIGAVFAEQAARRAAAVAVEAEGGRLSYGELNRRANQLAHYLRGLGVGAEARVGLCVERSLELVVGLLGILKAGGAYVPLDRDYPVERLRFMMAEAQLSVIVAEEKALAGLPAYGGEYLCLEREWPAISRASEAELESGVSGENLAYVLYTSGSSGTPKGVEVTHRAVLRLLLNTDYVRLSSETRVLALAPLSFDASTFELWAPLLHGGRLLLPPPGLGTAREMGAAIRRWGVETMWLTASLFNAVVDEGCEELRGLQQLLVGGEALSAPHLVRAQQALPGTRLINGYGPTEATTFSCCHEIGPIGKRESVPIGRPIANTESYVLDEWLGLTPVGVNGELYVGGDGLARGYLNRADLTAERFVPHPYARRGGERLYRTGDVVRYQGNGALEFVGRRDAQVKVRGYRIELGELEAALRAHAQVREVVAVVREAGPGNKQLVAYVVGEAEPGELRRYLKEKLPEYMAPQWFVTLQQLPLTASGKVDRGALPAPEPTGRAAGEEAVGPGTAVEEIVAGIWCEILGLQEVGRHDNFFELGGHSLLGTQVISRVREAFQVELPLRRLFEGATIKELAASVEAARGSGRLAARMPLRRKPRGAALPLSYAQQRLWLLDKLEPHNPSYHMATAVRLRGSFSVAALGRAVNELVARHEPLRTSFEAPDGVPVQVVTEAGRQEVALVDVSAATEAQRQAEVQRLMKEEVARPFDLGRGRLLRVQALRLGEAEHVVLITMHHIISDAWSLEIFVRELAQFYEASVRGERAQLPELPVQYADYAAAQREWLQGAVLAEQRRYWRQQLGGELPVLELPLDHVRPALQTFRGGRWGVSLAPETSAALQRLSRSEGATLFMTLLAGFKLLLHYYTGAAEIIVGTPIAGRNQVEVESLIGCFLNTLVLRTELRGAATFRELLGRVREVALEAYAHQEAPFELLLGELQPQRDLSRTPLFQVLFNLLNVKETELSLPGLVLESMATPEVGAKFDLTVYAYENQARLQFALVYNRDLFEEATIARMGESFAVLLTLIAQQPQQSLAQLQQQLKAATWQPPRPRPLGAGAQPFVEFARAEIEQSLAARFSGQVAAHGDHTAVKTKQVAWSYRELDRRAKALAHVLLARCGVAEARVALLFAHDAPLLAALLGVLKAGKTYVPLDPAYPRLRLEYMLRDSQAAALVTDNRNLALAEALAAGALLIVNVDELEAEDAEVMLPVVSPAALAYLLYTSGSTGQPKGVAQTHRNVLHHIRTYTNALQLRATDKLLQLASCSFDAAVMDIYGALLNGATLYPFDLRAEGFNGLGAWLNAERISVYHSTPTVYRYFMATLKSGEHLESLRLVVLGGEEARRQDVLDFQAHCGSGSVFVNGFGPTESTLALQYFLDQETELPRPTAPIGYAVADTTVRLLNEAGDEVIGFGPGEIELTSRHLAPGYWRRPELTAAAFKEDPSSGARRYRTGDMARRLGDGNLEDLGRRDGQVKVRGYRIELGEIEAVLAAHATVRACVVVAREDVAGDQRLVAYVVGAPASVAEWRRHLKQQLPEYMVPSSYVVLESLPLTPNGKVDRRALPAPEQTTRPQGKEHVAPGTAAEEIVAGIWCEILGLKEVGINDDFFELGGHSLLGTQVISRVQETFEVEMPLRSLFEHPTLSEFSIAIEAKIVESIEGLTEEEALAML